MENNDFLQQELEAVQPSVPTTEKQGKAKKLLKDFLDMARFTALLLVIYYVLSLFLFQFNTVDGSSMYPTMEAGDRIVVNKLSVLIGSAIHHGDIVTVKGEKVPSGLIDKDVIKRIVGVPGDHVQIQDGFVLINGKKLAETYLPTDGETFPLQPDFSDIQLGENEYYVLGDNRMHSADSRFFGVVTRSSIMGIVLFRFYPFTKIGSVQ